MVSPGGPGPGKGALIDPDKMDAWRGLDDGMRMFLLGQVAEGLLDALIRDGPEGVPVHRSLRAPSRHAPAGKGDRDPNREQDAEDHDGSCMIVIAVDAPLGSRSLRRIARRSFAGMARTGASFSHGSGDYAIAFSTAAMVRLRPETKPVLAASPNQREMTRLFQAVAEATEEAILNSLFRATSVSSRYGKAMALPLEQVRPLLEKARSR